MTVCVPNYFQDIEMIFHYYLWQSGDWGIFVAFSDSLNKVLFHSGAHT